MDKKGPYKLFTGWNIISLAWLWLNLCAWVYTCASLNPWLLTPLNVTPTFQNSFLADFGLVLGRIHLLHSPSSLIQDSLQHANFLPPCMALQFHLFSSTSSVPSLHPTVTSWGQYQSSRKLNRLSFQSVATCIVRFHFLPLKRYYMGFF